MYKNLSLLRHCVSNEHNFSDCCRNSLVFYSLSTHLHTSCVRHQLSYIRVARIIQHIIKHKHTSNYKTHARSIINNQLCQKAFPSFALFVINIVNV